MAEDHTEPGRAEDDGPVTATYRETESERRLLVQHDDRAASIAQNRDGYAMLKVRDGEGNERERYYGFAMALDHAAELVGVTPQDVPIPEAAADMGM